jgi:Alpha-glutamyl/putrescinyl thymine pyrophosphorylase clade 2
MLNKDSSHKPGRYNNDETSVLEYGMDFRKPKYRREVFLRFYEYHLKYKAHPGAVYYIFPYLIEKFNISEEDKFWLAYINGCSQNIITTWLIFEQFPSLQTLDMNKFSEWFREHYEKLGWDTDRRYIKNSLEKCIENYKSVLGDKTQIEFFNTLANSKDEKENFTRVWDKVINDFFLFGRLATFSYTEYLRIIGLPIECDSLFLSDISGSKSHRNGLCKVLGRDDLDWHDKLNPDFEGYTPEILYWLSIEGELLLEEARKRISGVDSRDINYFTLESTLCCYKSWHRKNRRYPNVYNDLFHDRIRYAEKKWEDMNKFNLFWEARAKYLPNYLRLELNPTDPGLCKEKQNHYRETGQVIMMDKEWDCFKNDFNNKYYNNKGIEEFL